MSRRILDKDAEENRFADFLINKEFVIEGFIEEAKRFGFDFDFSEYSLDMLESYYLRRESELNKDEIRKTDFIEAAARYLGDTLINNFGGHWTLSIDDPKDLFYGLPVIIGHSKYNIEFCPHEKIRMFTRQKKQGFLRRVIQNHINPIKLELTPE